jgi:2-dehydropantoate 2-reductase
MRDADGADHAVIAVVGVGAIGGVCAASLRAAGRDVVCCVRTPFDALVVETPAGTLRERVRVEVAPERVGAVEWVLLATKAHQTGGAASWLERVGGARVAVLQNGVEHVERVARWIDPARVVPVVIACPSTATSPGHVVQRSPATLTVPDDDNGRAFANLFAGTSVTVELAADWRTAAWRKLCSNVTGGALAALAGVPLPQVSHPRKHELAQALARECAAVARAEGADVSDAFADDIAAQAAHATAGGEPSTLTDRRRGRPLEVDARNGTVVRLGARHAIPTPVNARAATLMARAHLDAQRDLLDDV